MQNISTFSVLKKIIVFVRIKPSGNGHEKYG